MDIKQTVLDNGLRIITSECTQYETVSLGLWVKTGAAYETEDINGISHFVEHMVFKGTKKRNSMQISEEIEDAGGQSNAYTSREFTVFYAKMLKNDLELAIDVIADFVMSPTFPDDEMVKEKEVVVQEIKQSADSPEDAVYDNFQACVFPNQPLGRPILGTVENVRGFTPQMLHDYMSHNYAAENTVAVAVGNLKHETFVEMVRARMNDYRARTSFAVPAQIYDGQFSAEKRPIEQTHVLVGFKGVPYGHPLYYATSVFSTLFGGGMSSRLFREIREKRGLVYSVYSFMHSQTANGIFGIYAGTSGDQVNELMPVIADEIKKTVQENVSDKELNRAKTQLKASMLMALENSFSGAELIARQTLLYNKIIPTDDLVAKIEAVSAEDIRQTAQMIFSSAPAYTLLGGLKGYPDYEELKKYLKF